MHPAGCHMSPETHSDRRQYRLVVSEGGHIRSPQKGTALHTDSWTTKVLTLTVGISFHLHRYSLNTEVLC